MPDGLIQNEEIPEATTPPSKIENMATTSGDASKQYVCRIAIANCQQILYEGAVHWQPENGLGHLCVTLLALQYFSSIDDCYKVLCHQMMTRMKKKNGSCTLFSLFFPSFTAGFTKPSASTGMISRNSLRRLDTVRTIGRSLLPWE